MMATNNSDGRYPASRGGTPCIPPYVEPPPHSPNVTDNVLPLQTACKNLANQCEALTQMNETLHQKLSQHAVQLHNVQQTCTQNIQLNLELQQENERLRELLKSRGISVPPAANISLEVQQRLHNLEEIIYNKISDREIDRSDRMSGSSGGISLSNISLSSSALFNDQQHKDTCSTSAYSSLSSLDRIDSTSLRERVRDLENECLNLRSHCLKQDAKGKILEKTLRERNMLIKRMKLELESRPQVQQYREFTQI